VTSPTCHGIHATDTASRTSNPRPGRSDPWTITTPADFWVRGPSKARERSWDFLKNFALAGGFLLITFGTTQATIQAALDDPLGSTHPYSQAPR